MNEHIRAAKRKMEPTWNELRERRVLERVLDKARQPKAVATRRRGLWLGLGSAAAAGVAVALWIGLGASHDPLGVTSGREIFRASNSAENGAGARSPQRVATPPDAKVPSVVRFSEGSVATVSPGGELTVTLQRPERIELRQHRGQVRYRVKPDQTRSFQVIAAGVTVLVIGTEFTVAIQPGERVLIQVTKGVVEARDHKRRVRLHAGEKVLLKGVGIQPDSTSASASASASIKGSSVSAMATAKVASAGSPARTRPAPRVAKADVATILRRVDAARRKGQLSQAVSLLRGLIRRPTSDPRQRTARFILAQVEFARRHYAASARAYRGYRKRAQRSPLAEDALAGEARARWAAGQHVPARKLARLYLRRYSKGPHTRAMRDIIQ